MDKWFVIIEENGLFHTVRFNTRFEAMKYAMKRCEDSEINLNGKLYIAEAEELLLFKEMRK